MLHGLRNVLGPPAPLCDEVFFVVSSGPPPPPVQSIELTGVGGYYATLDTAAQRVCVLPVYRTHYQLLCEAADNSDKAVKGGGEAGQILR